MNLAIVHTRAGIGVQAPPVSVEIHLANGLPSLTIVGLPEAAVRESKDRVRSAIVNAGFSFPIRRITINLAPADLPKYGGRYDLPIALGILAASGQLTAPTLDAHEFLGELALSGELRAVQGALPAVIAAAQVGRTLVVPTLNGPEAALPSQSNTLIAATLLDVCQYLEGQMSLPTPVRASTAVLRDVGPDMADVIGQPVARRALEIAAAGRHNLLFFGPPGTGKSMLATRLPGLLPELSEDEGMAVAAVHSVAGAHPDPAHWRRPPYRSPHHSCSAVALVGGGSYPRPGEISQAHHGVLFLDELPEFDRKVLEVLREPLESGEITISRAARQVTFPARFQLIAAMNPCPCGFQGHPRIACRCSPQLVNRYRSKISGPLLDRFDMHVEVPAQETSLLLTKGAVAEASATIQQRVQAARERQLARAGQLNSQLPGKGLQDACGFTDATRQFLDLALAKLNLSARALHRVMRVARTIADLENNAEVSKAHLAEALGYRRLDRGAGGS